MWARPALKKGADVPDKYRMKELLGDKEAMERHAARVSRRPHSSPAHLLPLTSFPFNRVDNGCSRAWPRTAPSIKRGPGKRNNEGDTCCTRPCHTLIISADANDECLLKPLKKVIVALKWS